MTHEEDHIALVDLDGTVADCDGALKEAMETLRSLLLRAAPAAVARAIVAVARAKGFGRPSVLLSTRSENFHQKPRPVSHVSRRARKRSYQNDASNTFWLQR